MWFGLAEEKIIEGLMHFGIEREEAMAYIFLLRAGPCPARVLANKLGGNRMKAYRILKALQDRGLVEVTLGRPLKFVATPLNTALDILIEEYRSKLLSMEESKRTVLEYWERLPTAETSIEEPKFRIIKGRQNVYGLILKMFDRVKTEIRLLTTRNDLYRLLFVGLDGQLRAMSKRGIKVWILTQLDVQGIDAVNNYLNFAEIRHTSLPAILRLLTIDENESITTFVMDDSMSMTTEEDFGLWTNASNYIKAMNATFSALWGNSTPVQELLPKLMARQELMEGLNFAKRSLEAEGWSVEVPGRLFGVSGVEHSFGLVAKHPDIGESIIAVDLLTEDKPLYQLLTLNLKLLDVRGSKNEGSKNEGSIHFIAVARSLGEKELKLASQYGIIPVIADKAEALARKIANEVKSLRGRGLA